MTTPIITERDVVLARRAAFQAGIGAAHRDYNACWQTGLRQPLYSMCGEGNSRRPYIEAGAASDMARERYPLPKVERPRVVPDPEQGFDQEWRWIGCRLQWRATDRSGSGSTWYDAFLRHDDTGFVANVTPKRLAVWADLAANPTELVDDA